MPISFPGLFGDWEFNPDPIAIHIGHGVYWYGIILAIGLLAGLLLCLKQSKRYGLIYVDQDNDGSGTGERIRKKSFYWYRDVIASHGENL